MSYISDRINSLPLEEIAGSESNSRKFIPSMKSLLTRRDLIKRLISRELRGRYKDSNLGVFWALGRPLIQLSIYYFVIGKFLGASRSIDNFAIYVFSGLTLWTFFTEVVSQGTNSIVANAGLIKKVSLPREIFPLTALGSGLINFAFQSFVLFIAALIIVGPFQPFSIIYFLGGVLIVSIYGLAISLVLSGLNVFFRDIQHLLELALLILFWASPIVYSFSMVKNIVGEGPITFLYSANPITIAIIDIQQAFWARENTVQELPNNFMLINFIVIFVGILAVGAAQRIFSRLQVDFAQEL